MPLAVVNDDFSLAEYGGDELSVIGERVASLETNVRGIASELREHRTESRGHRAKTETALQDIKDSLEAEKHARAIRETEQETERKVSNRFAAIGGGIAGGAATFLLSNLKAVGTFVMTIAR